MGEKILEIKDLSVRYVTDEGVAKAVNNLNFSLEKGSAHGLVGETGAGKTTTALSILRLVPDPPGIIESGSIVLNGTDLLTLSESEMDKKVRGIEVSMIFQDPMTSLNPVMTVSDQIAEVIYNHQKVSKVEAARKAAEMLEMVGIPAERGDEYPHQFSGGMKQRVIIAIALACKPNILIADEPTTALDVTIQAQILDKIKDLREQLGMSMIMITHDLGIVAEVCDYVSVIYAGRIVEHGHVKEVFRKPAHPYTVGLFNSLPKINDDREMLEPIPGMMPDPMELPEGCAFFDRCPYAREECSKAIPAERLVEGEHYVSCNADIVRKGDNR